MWPAKSSLRSSFLDHLEELRSRLLISLAAVLFASIVAYSFSRPLLDFLIRPLRVVDFAALYFQAPYEAFLVRLKISLLAGVLGASPVFFTQLWLFVAPGLHREERRALLPVVLVSVFLFLAGAAFAFWVLLPLGLQFLLGFQTHSLRPLLSISPYFSFLMTLVLGCGLVFILPAVLLGLVKMEILNVQTLERSRKGTIVLIFILTAVLTPSADPFSQILLALPLILLYEGCIGIGKWIERKK